MAAGHAALLPWIPGLPLLAFIVLIFTGRRLGRLSAWLSVAALAGSFLLTLAVADPVFHGSRLMVGWPWLSAEDPRWSIGLAVDGLSWLMLLVVTAIGTMIQLYSIGYMHGDPRFSRFFAYLSLFCASMLGLVLADHFVLLYACWELVGLCSYFLISFWFEKPAAAAAGRKAFITTRIGDTGLLVGIFLLAWTVGDLHVEHLDDVHARFLAGGQTGWLTLISALIFLGAVGKSAQVPLHVWLPDAMEGPTPVSALIHAATMVAAGVYLVARTLPLFTPQSLQLVLGIGLLTHLMAGTVALTQTDIKRILAYSTISQLGLMMTALGLGAMAAAMFHLFTHAFFKALLFLGAGSVIHATREQELGRLGGLRRTMPWTAAVFLVASLAMSGLFPLSGFWSKDAVLLAAEHTRPWVMGLLLLGAVMTTAYIFRLYLRCFHLPAPQSAAARQAGGAAAPAGPRPHARPGSHEGRAGESPWMMLVPMVALAVGAACAGFVGAPMARHAVFRLLGAVEVHGGIDVPILVWSTLALSLGFVLAWVVGYQRRTCLPAAAQGMGRQLYRWAAHKYYVDEAYQRVLITPFVRATQRLSQFDQEVVDGAVNGAGRAGWSLGQWKAWVDQQVVDRFVNALAWSVRGVGAELRWMQTGVIQQYLLVVVVSVVLLSVLLRAMG